MRSFWSVGPLVLLGLCGCTIIQPVEPETGHYYLNPDVDFGSIGKVAVLEFKNLSNQQEQTELLTQSLEDSLGKKHLFSLLCINRLDPQWQALNLDGIANYNFEQLALIRRELHVDAVLFGTICRYAPYPHFLTHLRLKMVSTKDGKLIWAMEEVWDSADKKTAQRMKQFFDDQMREGYAPMDWKILITSPRAFGRFVTYEVAQTLPANSVGPIHYPQASEKSGLFSVLGGP